MMDSVMNILDSGPYGASLHIAVPGDGFTASCQSTYKTKINELLIDGMFDHHYAVVT